jgi:general secretion pathway protein G
MKLSALKIAWYTFGSLAILIPIVALTLPNILGKQIICDVDLRQCMVSAGGPVALQIELYNSHIRRYPTSLSDLTTRPASAEAWQGPYIENPNQFVDPWGRPLRYRYPAQRSKLATYDLWSAGPDGVDFTDDDVTNYSPE